MKLNIALLRLLMLNVVLVIVLPSEANNLPSMPQWAHDCQQYDPNTSESCGSEDCPPGVRNFTANSGFSSGEGKYSLEHLTTLCTSGNGTTIPCEDSSVPIVIRQDDSGYCCDRDNDGYVGAHPQCPTATDCRDDNSSINPGAAEDCGNPNADNNCNNQYGCDDWACYCNQSCCGGQGASCIEDCNCCDGYVCGESGTCIECIVDPNNPQGGCMSQACIQCYQNGGTYCDPWSNACWTPIVIDVLGDGFNLTNAANGIHFDGFGNGILIHTAWTSANSDDAWLVLDRNGNGTIDNGTELFSSAAPQAPPPEGEIKNGFLALAEYDKTRHGGNRDGVINKQDAIFSSLRLWQDTNHNGFSEPSEVHILKDLGLKSIYLDYRESRRVDQYGNHFRYRTKVKDVHDAQLGRWAWDVFPVVAQ